MSKTLSLKQIAANRHNAQKSTGPKTPGGRAVSKMNALKHGILSKEVLVRGIQARESARELRALHAQFLEHYKPVGPVEGMLVDQIVTTHWRLRRVLKAESGEIALSVDKGHWDRKYQNPALDAQQWEAHGDPVYDMGNSVLGNFIIEKKLKEVRASVEKEGELTEAAIQFALLHGQPNNLTRDLEKLHSQLQQNPEGLEVAVWRAKQKEQALAYIDEKLHFISWHNPECEEHEEKEEEARQAAAVLPSLAVLEKIMRYATMLERQMYRAINQLERLQRRRLGEAVPPPLSMVV
ncbi:MAG: hypothetical protein WBN75_16030 [Verrucomicrobiia bacterium]